MRFLKTVNKSFTGVPSSLNNPGETINFNVSATDPDGDSLTYTINFGDGTANGSGSQVVHTYEAGAGGPPHIYTATVTVNDGNGNIVGESLQVTVDDIPPAEPTNVSAN
ncbi:MAG: PKD domain-containing protein [Deltaproteobacteria bacterium]|nr:PKD domain-containing protein [Deltaproteobacteria bacterium]